MTNRTTLFAKPELPPPRVSDLANRVGHCMVNSYRMTEKYDQVRTFYFANMSLCTRFHHHGKLVALHLLQSYSSSHDYIRWYYFCEPPGLNRRQLFDRFSGIALKAGLPALLPAGRLWLWTDGVPWYGQRLFLTKNAGLKRSFKTSLERALQDPWH